MRKTFLTLVCLAGATALHAQSYNPLWIPDTLSGTAFNLKLQESTKQFLSGSKTATSGINGNFWGPTLIFRQGDTVRFNVENTLPDTATIHWHGMHLPAMMDGGPHQMIAPTTTWKPYYKVMNNAATYWYHPHMNSMALHQITTGLGGMIIVLDQTESKLALPRTYGVDDIPLALTDRRFLKDGSNNFSDVSFGDTMMVNGTLNPQISLPAQVVRFRILNAALERTYNIGFSDNRQFYVITSDGGLLDKPVAVTRYWLSSAERIEILVDLSTDKGKSLDLKAYNASLPRGITGSEPSFPPGPLANALGARDFNMLHIAVGASTANPVTAIPSSLVTNTFLKAADATVTRNISITDTILNGRPSFSMNHHLGFDMMLNDYNVKLGTTEIWSIKNTSVVGHPFHIHDIEFYILSRNGVAPPTYEQGWKDVVLVKQNETVRFIARFDDFADTKYPFMFHCHIAAHEDDGLMGQFVVTNSGTGINGTSAPSAISLYPNPANEKCFISLPAGTIFKSCNLTNVTGQEVTADYNSEEHSLDISALPAGIYFVHVLDEKGKVYSGKIIKSQL